MSANLDQIDEKTRPSEFTAYVRKEGKITVPKEVRDAMGIRRGDLVQCKILRLKAQ